MARKLNIPARLAGGLVCETGRQAGGHQWVEVCANGHWVPFDTINDHFAELPAHYLRLYTAISSCSNTR
jgi:transglutaminase-like putative cysteine protease